MEWISFPFKEDKKKGIITLIFIFLLSVSVYFLVGKFYGLFTFTIIILSVLPYYTPTYYKIDKDSIIIKHLGIKRVKKWDELKKCYVEKKGVFLSPFDFKTRLENYRGIYLRINENMKDDVVKFIKENTSLNIIGG